MTGTLFGREPALVLGFVGSVLTFLVSLNVSFIDAGAAAAVLALLTAIVTAAVTRPIAPPLFAGIITAAAALGAQYGLNVPDSTVAAASAILLAAFSLAGVRPQVSPKR